MHISRSISCLIILFLLFSNTISSKSKVENLEDRYKYDFLFYEAAQAQAQGEYGAAFDYLKYCYGIDSTNSAVLYELGNFYNTIGDKNKALAMYKGAVIHNPNNYYYSAAYGLLCLENKDYKKAIDLYSAMTEKYPDRTNLYLYLAEAYRLNNELPKAVESLDKLEQFVGMNEKISLQKFQLYRQMKQEQKAFAEIQKYIDKYPTEISYYILLGDLYLHADRDAEALRTYSKAKSIDPDNPYLISSMASYYEKAGKQEEAENELKIALISHKMDVESKLGILAQYVGTLQQRGKEIESANALFDSLMVQHPQEPSLNMMYGNLLSIQGKKDKAREQYHLFAKANPSNPTGWEQMLSTVFPDSLQLTIEVCEEALNYLPDQPQFYFYLGLAHYLEKEYEPALEALKKGVSHVEERNLTLLSDFYTQIGDLFYHTAQVDSAFVAYDKALKANPNNLGAMNNYSYFLSVEKKDLDKAERMSSKTIKADPLNPTYLDTYGWVLFRQGAYGMAKIYIENAIENSKDKEDDVSGEVYEHYGDILYKLGDKEKALEYWIKAKEKGDSKSKTLDKKIDTKEYIEE